MLAEWLLILVVSRPNAVKVETIQFTTQVECEAAAKTLKNDQSYTLVFQATCVKRTRYIQ